MYDLVVDTSNNNPITLAQLKASRAKGLIAKASEGDSFSDGWYAQQRLIAKNAGVLFGAYYFLHPFSDGSEAGRFLAAAKLHEGDMQPIIDAEVTDGGSIADLAARVNRSARALEVEGYAPILYSSASMLKQMFAVVPALKRLRVWEAQYPGHLSRWNIALAKLRIKLGLGTKTVMWQFTDALAVGGKRFDASVALVPLSSLTIGSNL